MAHCTSSLSLDRQPSAKQVLKGGVLQGMVSHMRKAALSRVPAHELVPVPYIYSRVGRFGRWQAGGELIRAACRSLQQCHPNPYNLNPGLRHVWPRRGRWRASCARCAARCSSATCATSCTETSSPATSCCCPMTSAPRSRPLVCCHGGLTDLLDLVKLCCTPAIDCGVYCTFKKLPFPVAARSAWESPVLCSVMSCVKCTTIFAAYERRPMAVQYEKALY